MIYQRAAGVARESALQELRAAARAEANAVADLLNQGPLLTRSLARSLLDDIEAGRQDRERSASLAMSLLQPQKQFVGMAMGFEPEAFDGRDAEFAGVDAMHDASGRFVPYFFHTPRGVESTVLEDIRHAGTR